MKLRSEFVGLSNAAKQRQSAVASSVGSAGRFASHGGGSVADDRRAMPDSQSRYVHSVVRVVLYSHSAVHQGMVSYGWGVLSFHMHTCVCVNCTCGGSRQRPDSDQLLVQAEVDFNAALVQERQEQFRHIEREVTMVGDIFKDLSLLVNEQGIQIGTRLLVASKDFDCCSDCLFLMGLHVAAFSIGHEWGGDVPQTTSSKTLPIPKILSRRDSMRCNSLLSINGKLETECAGAPCCLRSSD
jgi:hypothetical protein